MWPQSVREQTWAWWDLVKSDRNDPNVMLGFFVSPVLEEKGMFPIKDTLKNKRVG